MAATTAGAFKAWLESLGLGIPVYRDGKPKSSGVWKYLTVQEGIAIVDDQSGDFGDATSGAAPTTVIEDVQLDLYDLARELVNGQPGTRNLEDYALPTTLHRLLRGNGLAPYAPTLVYGHRPISRVRWPITDNTVRHTWTVRVHREL